MNRWDKALKKYKQDKRMTLHEYVCFMIGLGFCSSAYKEFIDFIKNHRCNYARKYEQWKSLMHDWNTWKNLDNYRKNV